MSERVGQQLGNYILQQLLGQGGFADVYLGEHIYLKSQAAIKILQTRLSDSSDIDAFLREAQTIARLSHPNIVRVLDFGMAQDTPFLVMDYAPNGTLRSRHVRGVSVPLMTILPYVRQISDALQYAHDERLIHRDIKPENMLLGRRNEVLLSDFGIALVAQSSRSQGTQDVIGTVSYMSPEQIQGKPRPASDQYSLAIVIYEWLSGERPFQGSFTELCTQHMFAAPSPLTEKLARFSPEVNQVILKALDKDPKLRYESMQLFFRAFEEASQQAMQSAQTIQVSPDAPLLPSAPAQPGTSYATVFMPESLPSARKTVTPSSPGAQPPFVPTSTFHSSETAARARPEDLPTYLQSQSQPQSSTRPAQPQFSAGIPQRSPRPSDKVILPAQQPQRTLPPVPPANSYPASPQSFAQNSQAPIVPPQAYAANTIYNAPPAQSAGPQRPPAQPASYAAGNQQQQQQYSMPPSSPRSNAFESLERGYQPPPPSPARPEPRPEPRRPAPEPARESDEEWWGFLGSAKWPILASLLGIVLVCIVHNFHPLLPGPFSRRILVLLIVPLFFGAAFGPWVGLAVGLGGLFAGNLIFAGEDGLRVTLFGTIFNSYGPAVYSWWIPILMYGLAGFAPGLTMLGKRKYPSISSVLRAILLSLILFAAVVGFILYQANALRSFPSIGLILLLNLLIALILLIVYSVIIRLIDPAG